MIPMPNTYYYNAGESILKLCEFLSPVDPRLCRTGHALI